MKKNLKQLRADFIWHYVSRDLDNFFNEWDVNEVEFEGTADEFHNFATELARAGYYGRGCNVLEQGIDQYSKNTDLLADYLNFGIKCGQNEQCDMYYRHLDQISDKRKKWRAFEFSIDYLLFKISEEDDDENIAQLKETAFKLTERFKKTLPESELAYLAEFQIYDAICEKETGLNKLRQFLDDPNRTAKVAPKCHLRYIEEMLNRGEYEEVIDYANDGAAEAAQEQEGVDTGFFFYAFALAKDALWIKADKGKENVDKEEADKILRYYQTAYDSLDEDKNEFFKVINKRYKIIANLADLDRKLNDWRNEQKDTADLMQRFNNMLQED